MKTFKKISIVFSLILIATYGVFRAWEYYWYSGLIPSQLQITSTIFVDGISGLRGGCGAAVFGLSDSNISDIRSRGIASFNNIHEARSHKDAHYFTFGTWKETPYVITADGLTMLDRWLIGIDCAEKMDPLLRQKINKAFENRGSFYSTASTSGLIVLPDLGLVVLSYGK